MDSSIDNQYIEEIIDNEDYNSNDVVGPFDPNDIDVDISTVNLGLLLDDLEDKKIKMDPEFQRDSNVWTNIL